MTEMTYRVRRPILVGEDKRAPGDLVPEAVQWFRVDHLTHAGFIVWGPTLEGELEDALSYSDDPRVWEKHGYTMPEQTVTLDEETVDLGDEEHPGLAEWERELLEAPPSILDAPIDYESMPWPELRKLGKAAGMPNSATKADIIAELTKD